MKRSIARALWTICVLIVVFSLVRMFFGSDYWMIYAMLVGVGFYITKKIFKKHLVR